MKIVILGDTHFALRNSLPVFYHHYTKFYDHFFDYLINNNITTVLQLGDLFDNKKSTNTRSLKFAKEVFFDRLQENNIALYTLLGNHDIHFKETLMVNTPELVLKEYNNITIFNKPTNITLDNISIDIIPWICKENEQESLDFIKNSLAKLCFGHFEIKDYPMFKDIETNTGLNRELFKNYELVISGHYHTFSNRDNILYTGVPYQMTWQDYNDNKGFYIYDTQDNTIEFIKNPFITFHKFLVDDNIPDITELDLEECFVKVTVKNNQHPEYDNFIKELYNKKCHDIKINEEVLSISSDNNDIIDIEDTISIINNYIDNSNISIDKSNVKSFMESLYLESIKGE